MILQIIKNTIGHSLTRQCPLCELELNPEDGHWCADCLQWFEPKPRCRRCGERTLSAVNICGKCLHSPPLWNSLYCLGDYGFPLDNYIHKIKHQRQFWHISPLCQLLASRIEDQAELLIPVPLHWRRYLYRGFNQSNLIAQQLSHYLKIPYTEKMIQRTHATRPQQGLRRESRLNNLRHAFRLRHIPTQSHIAIVDDVVTTGTTINQLCQLLFKSGVKRVDVYCLCRTTVSSPSI